MRCWRGNTTTLCRLRLLLTTLLCLPSILLLLTDLLDHIRRLHEPCTDFSFPLMQVLWDRLLLPVQIFNGGLELLHIVLHLTLDGQSLDELLLQLIDLLFRLWCPSLHTRRNPRDRIDPIHNRGRWRLPCLLHWRSSGRLLSLRRLLGVLSLLRILARCL